MPELIVPISVTRKITKAGPHDYSGDPIIVRFDQATEGEIFDREAFIQPISETQFRTDGTRVASSKSPAWPETRAYDIWLTMRECNLTKNKKPIFTFKDKRANGSFADFLKAWRTIDPNVTEALYVECLRANPHWNYGVVIPPADEDEEEGQQGNDSGEPTAETDDSE